MLSLFLSTLKCLFTVCLFIFHELYMAVCYLAFLIFNRLYGQFYLLPKTV